MKDNEKIQSDYNKTKDTINYIKPKLKNHDTLEDLFNSSDTYFPIDADIKIDDLMKNKATIIIGEPGVGKTRLLKEAVLESSLPAIFIDLKKIETNSIENYIKENYLEFLDVSELENIDNKKILDKDRIIKNNFKLNFSKKLLFCLDALDEVNNEYFYAVVDDIKKIINKYDNCCFLISCRKNYINKWEYLFREDYLRYVEILSLDYDEMKEFLIHHGIEENSTEKLLHKLYFENRQPILKNPRYLEMIASLIQKHGINEFNNISRIDLFEKFVYQTLNIESKKNLLANSNEMIKKVLEKLALVMEIYQSNQISKDELMEFFDDIKSNISVGFLNQVPIEKFYNRSLLKDNIDSIEFYNTEFQEYLAAKEILRMGRIDQVLFDLVVIKELNEINPSWINTLSFVIEFEPSIIKKILEYIFKNEVSVSIENCVKLLTNVNANKLNIDDKYFIFKKLYSFYQEHGQWMHYDTSEILSLYYDNSLYSYIEDYYIINNNKNIKKIIDCNTISLIAFLLEKNLLNNKQTNEWVSRLRIVLDSEKDKEILSRAIFAISKIKDISLFSDDVKNKIMKTGDDQLVSSLVGALEYIDMDNKTTIDYILNGVKIDNIHSRLSLYKIKNNKSIKYFLDKLTSDEDLLDSFIEHESTYHDRTDKLIHAINIATSKDYTINEILKNIIIKSCSSKNLWHKSRGSYFLEQIALIVGNNLSDFIFELIEIFKTQGLFYIENIIVILLKKENLKQFIDLINELNQLDRVTTIFSILKNKNNELYEFGRQYLHKEYIRLENLHKEFDNNKKNQEEEVYNKFKELLNLKNLGIFSFYIENKQLKNIITEEEKETLTKFIDTMFNLIDPTKEKVSISSRNGDSRSYKISNLILILESCIIIAKEFSLDISPYRQKILNILPFSYDNVRNAIFSLIDNPTNSEITNFLNEIKNRKDDLMIFNPESTIEFFNKNNLNEGIPLLKIFIELDNISIYDKKYAIETIAKICSVENEEKKFFISIFNKYKADEDTKVLATTANYVLINKFYCNDAIDWRFDSIKNNYFAFIRKEGVHSMDSHEIELDSKEFAKPLMLLKDIKYKDKFLELLRYSFDIFNKGDEFHQYAFYIWSIVVEYFKNLKELRDYKHLDDLEKIIKSNKDINGMNWFLYQYQQLRLDYIMHITNTRENILECIKKYNDIKESTHLNVATAVDLYELLKNAIEKDLKKWIEVDGAYDVFNTMEKYKKSLKKFEGEKLIQKTIKSQLENILFKNKLRPEQFNIIREAQLINDIKPDFIVSYGFVGRIIIELKLTTNSEIKTKKERDLYKNKLITYMKGLDADYCIFLVFQVNKINTIEKYETHLKNSYESEGNIKVIGFNCIKDID